MASCVFWASKPLIIRSRREDPSPVNLVQVSVSRLPRWAKHSSSGRLSVFCRFQVLIRCLILSPNQHQRKYAFGRWIHSRLELEENPVPTPPKGDRHRGIDVTNAAQVRQWAIGDLLHRFCIGMDSVLLLMIGGPWQLRVLRDHVHFQGVLM